MDKAAIEAIKAGLLNPTATPRDWHSTAIALCDALLGDEAAPEAPAGDEAPPADPGAASGTVEA